MNEIRIVYGKRWIDRAEFHQTRDIRENAPAHLSECSGFPGALVVSLGVIGKTAKVYGIDLLATGLGDVTLAVEKIVLISKFLAR